MFIPLKDSRVTLAHFRLWDLGLVFIFKTNHPFTSFKSRIFSDLFPTYRKLVMNARSHRWSPLPPPSFSSPYKGISSKFSSRRWFYGVKYPQIQIADFPVHVLAIIFYLTVLIDFLLTPLPCVSFTLMRSPPPNLFYSPCSFSHFRTMIFLLVYVPPLARHSGHRYLDIFVSRNSRFTPVIYCIPKPCTLIRY